MNLMNFNFKFIHLFIEEHVHKIAFETNEYFIQNNVLKLQHSTKKLPSYKDYWSQSPDHHACQEIALDGFSVTLTWELMQSSKTTNYINFDACLKHCHPLLGKITTHQNVNV